MEVGKLTVQVRTSTGKGAARKLRTSGQVPGVCYGAGLSTPLQITVNAKALKASLDPTKGRNTVISVALEDGGKTQQQLTAMVKDYQIHALKRNVTHVDLLAIDPTKALEVEVPLAFTGKAIGTVEGGVLHTERHSLPVRCLPAQIPAQIALDVSSLGIGDAFHVSDVKLPPGVEAAIPAGFALVSCVAPKAEKEVETVAVAAEGAAPAEGAAAAAGAAAPAAGDAKKGDAKKGDAKKPEAAAAKKPDAKEKK